MALEVEALEQDEQVAPAQKQGLRHRIIRAVLIALLVFLFGPYLLILLYRIDFVRPVSTLMLADLATFQGYDRRWVDFEDISPNVVKAVMMSEDGQYCNHGGVDWNQLQSVIDDAMAGEATRGASTIPMQTAKNLFLWEGRSYVRKGLEAWFTVVLELCLPKDRILDLYLNLAEWGDGVFGAEMAARTHFKKSAKNLTRDEAARLAAVLPSPRKWSPKGSIASRRASGIIQRMQYPAPHPEDLVKK